MKQIGLIARTLVTLAIAVGAGSVAWSIAVGRIENPVSATAAIHAELTDVESASELMVYCYRLQEIPGVSAVSVRLFQPTVKRATVVIFYDPTVISPRYIRRFLRLRAILWEPNYNV